MSYTVDVFPTQNLVSKITIIRVKKGCLKTSIIFRVLGWTTFFKERYRYYFSRWDHKREDTDVLLHPNFHYILCCVMSMKSSNIYHAHVWEKIKILANQTLLKIVLFFLIIRRQNKFFIFVCGTSSRVTKFHLWVFSFEMLNFLTNIAYKKFTVLLDESLLFLKFK